MSAVPQQLPQDRAASALWALDPGVGRREWVRIGMAAKEAGLEFEHFNEWSTQAGNYGGEADTRDAWRSFRPGGGVSEATLFGLARAAGWREESPMATQPRRAIPVRQEGLQRGPAWPVVQAWAECVPATAAHAYIERKGGDATGLRMYPLDAPPRIVAGEDVRGWLVVPAYGQDGAMATLQFISPSPGGRKLNLPGHTVDGWFTLGDLQADVTVYVCEGIGAAWAAHQTNGAAALVAFGAGNQRKVAEAVKRTGSRPVIVADRGKEQQCERAALEVGCGWVAMPSDLSDNGDLDDIKQANGIEAVRAVLERAQLAAANDNARPSGFGFLPVGSMLDHLKPIDWLVRGYLEADSLALLFGDPGCGKSFVAIDMACAIATGSPWHGKATTHGAVFYIAGEGHNGLARRFKAWELLNGESLADAPLYVSQRSAALYDGDSAAQVSEAVQQLAQQSGQQPRLIVIDTLARNFGGADENSTSDMNAFVTNLDGHLKDRFKACVLVVHHTGHADKSRARGAMALKGALDAEYQLERDEDGVIRWATTKMKDAEHPEPLSFRLERVALPFLDEDGQQVFGAAPKSAAYVPPAKPGKAGKGKNQTVALQVLHQMEADHRARLEAAGRDVDEALVKEDDWRATLIGKHGLNRYQFRDVKNSLTDARLIVIEPGGYVRTA